MSDFNQDIENLLNAYDSNWDDYLILREQFIEKYSLSVDKLEDHLMPYSKEMIQKIRDEKMQLVTREEFLQVHKEKLAAVRDNDKLQKQLNTAKKALTELAYGEYNTFKLSAVPIAKKALAALEGGEDED